MTFTRKEIVARLEQKTVAGIPLVGVPTQIGMTDEELEGRDVDLVIVRNALSFQAAGSHELAGMLCYGDANRTVLELGADILRQISQTPILAGVCGTDPFRVIKRHLMELKQLGFSGIVNDPTVGLFDGMFRAHLEETDLGYDLEVEMIGEAHQLDLFTCPFVFTESEARKMANAGADAIIVHLGLVTQGPIGKMTALSPDECASRIQAICDAAKSVNAALITFCYGGPIATADMARQMLSMVQGLDGFVAKDFAALASHGQQMEKDSTQ
jgi:Predicted TIM-barrel enzyme, possibly a dioxygenase